MVQMIKLEQGTQQWLDWRLSGITATEASCIIGASKWGTALTVWENKLHPKEHGEQTPAQEWGSRIEPLLRAKFAENHPEYIVSQGECYADGWKKCSLDGELERAEPDLFGKEILECKTGHTSADWANDSVPAGYYAQAQWQMLVTGRTKVWFAVLIGGTDYFERQVDFDADYCKTLESKCQAVWNCVLNNTRPELDTKHGDLDQAVLNNLAVENNPDRQDSFDLSDEEVGQYLVLKEEYERIERAFKASRAHLTQYLQNYNTLMFHGQKFGRMVVLKGRETVDTKLLKEKYPDVYEDVKRIGQGTAYPKFG